MPTDDQDGLVPDEQTLTPPAEEGQPQPDKTQTQDASTYVTRAEYEKLQQDLRRVQSSSDKGLNAIRTEMKQKIDSAVSSFTMATGQAPTPEQLASIRANVRDNLLSSEPDGVTPQPGQAPAGKPPQQTPDVDPWFQAANTIAATVDGGLTDKDPEMKLVKLDATPAEWLVSIQKAVDAKKARLDTQKNRPPTSTSMVTGNGGKVKPVAADAREAWNQVDYKR